MKLKIKEKFAASKEMAAKAASISGGTTIVNFVKLDKNDVLNIYKLAR